MTKNEAMRRLGGTPTTLAHALGIASQAIYSWPADGELPCRINDRVLAAIARQEVGERVLLMLADQRAAKQQQTTTNN